MLGRGRGVLGQRSDGFAKQKLGRGIQRKTVEKGLQVDCGAVFWDNIQEPRHMRVERIKVGDLFLCKHGRDHST